MQDTTLFTTTLTRFINSLQARNVSAHTIVAYRTDLKQFFHFLSETDISVTTPTAITRTHVIDYLASLAQQGRSGVTRARKLAAIREYCKFLVEQQIIPHSPASSIKMPKKEKKQKTYLRPDEYSKMLAAAGGNARDFCILQLFLQTGIRV